MRSNQFSNNNNDDDDEDGNDDGLTNEEEKRLFYVASTRAKERLYLLNGWVNMRSNYWEEPQLFKLTIEFIGNRTMKEMTEVMNTIKKYNQIYLQNSELYDKIFDKENHANEEYDTILKMDIDGFEKSIHSTNKSMVKDRDIKKIRDNSELEI